MSYESLNGKQNGTDPASFRQGTIRSAAASVASSSFRMRSHDNEHLSEPLTAGMTNHDDPYFVFRVDLMQKLELVDEGLADFLRVVHQTVCSFIVLE